MATSKQYFDAARNADAAGDTEAARRLVALARAQREVESTAERSAAMGGEFPSEGEVVLAEQRAVEEAETARAKRQASLPPGIIPDVRDEVADVRRRIEEGRSVASPGGAAEGGYFAERESTRIPFLRPTRIEEVPRPAPEVGSERVIREFVPPLAEPQPRPPTETEEIIESFARQPVLTREAGRQLAAGARPDDVQKRVGPMEGAVIETPFQAILRAAPASVEAMATEAYQRLPGPTSPLTSSGLYTRYLRGLSEAAATSESAPIRALADVPAAIATGIETAEETRKRLAAPVQETALRAVRGGVGALERVAGVTPGSSPLAQELAALDAIPAMPQVAIPAPSAIPDKLISQRIREGETLADVIRADPATVRVYDREFGALAPLAIEATGLSLSAPLPFSPVGALVDVFRVTGATKAATKAATGMMTRRAVAQADRQLAAELWKDAVGGRLGDIPKGLTLDTVADAARQRLAQVRATQAADIRQQFPTLTDDVVARVTAERIVQDARAVERLVAATPRARADLARVAPRADLVRVSPSYAVPATLVPRVVADAAADVRALREQARARGRALTRAEETAARDAAVARAAQAEAKRLDELGQFQVLLDGISTPRVWDGEFARAFRAAYLPGGVEQAMKRASVAAAEQEVARQGMDTLRQFRREVEAESARGKSLDDILAGIGARELRDMPPEEIAKKVLEEAYGGERARTLAGIAQARGADLLRPTVARALHEELVRTRTVPSAISPNFAANATKIIVEEGVRKRVSRDALDAYARQYPGSPRPTLAVPGTVGRLEADALLSERKFFETGVEERFRLIESIPTRAATFDPTVTQAAERLAAVYRSAKQNVRIPVLADMAVLGGEVAMAPVRAYLTTRYTGLPVWSDMTGVTTPYGYLGARDIARIIDDLGGFGPSRMDVARMGNLTSDILYSATKNKTGNVVKDVLMGRPWAYSLATAIEEGYRRGVFVRALQEGRTPEAAIELARRSQLDYGLRDDFDIIQKLSPYLARSVDTMAAGAEFIDKMAKNPRNYSTYLRALREQQRRQDPSGEMGDAPLRRALAPLTDEQAERVLGRPVDVLGPNAPILAPVDATIGLAQAVAGTGAAAGILIDEGPLGLVSAALSGSAEAMDEIAGRMALASAGLGGEPPSDSVATQRRALGPASIDQTYMATLALARAYDPDGTTGLYNRTLQFLAPEFEKPPKDAALNPRGDPLRWAVRPPDRPGAYVFTDMVETGDPARPKIETYFVIRPSKVGRQNLRTVAATPIVGTPFAQAVTAAGAAIESGVGEGILWGLGAETIEEPTVRAVEQVRPTTP